MNSHIASVHSKQNCHICNEVFKSKAALINHVRKHLTNQLQYTYGVCQKDYKNIEDAKDLAINICRRAGNAKEKCTNGPNCKYHKEDRCSFEHDTVGEQP